MEWMLYNFKWRLVNLEWKPDELRQPDQPDQGHQLWQGGRETQLSPADRSSRPPGRLTQSQVQGSAWTAAGRRFLIPWLTSSQLCSSLKTEATLYMCPLIYTRSISRATRLCNKDSLFHSPIPGYQCIALCQHVWNQGGPIKMFSTSVKVNSYHKLLSAKILIFFSICLFSSICLPIQY